MLKIIFKWLLRLILGGALIYAGVLKMLDPQAFADSIAGFQIVPRELINLIALSLPPFEILLGVALILAPIMRLRNNGIRQSVALTTTCLFAAFVFMLGQAIVRGIAVDCGCFGGGASWMESWSPTARVWFSLVRAFALFLGALWLWKKELEVSR